MNHHTYGARGSRGLRRGETLALAPPRARVGPFESLTSENFPSPAFTLQRPPLAPVVSASLVLTHLSSLADSAVVATNPRLPESSTGAPAQFPRSERAHPPVAPPICRLGCPPLTQPRPHRLCGAPTACACASAPLLRRSRISQPLIFTHPMCVGLPARTPISICELANGAAGRPGGGGLARLGRPGDDRQGGHAGAACWRALRGRQAREKPDGRPSRRARISFLIYKLKTACVCVPVGCASIYVSACVF